MAILRYARNVGRSFKYALPEIVKSKFPSIGQLASHFTDVGEVGADALVEARGILKENVTDVLNKGWDRAIKDAKRGHLFGDPSRDALGAFEGMNGDFGDDFNFGEDINLEDPGASAGDEGGSAPSMNAETAQAASYGAAVGASSAITAAAARLSEGPSAKATAAATETTARLHRVNIGTNIALMGQVRGAVMAGNQLLHQVHSFQMTQERAFYQESLTHYAAMRGLTSDISEKLNSVIEGLAVTATASDAASAQYSRHQSDFSKVFDSAGGFNVREYVGIVTRRLRTSVSGSLTAQMTKQMADNPLGAIAERIIEAVVPERFQKTLERFDKFVADLGVNAVNRLGKVAQDLENSSDLFKQATGRLLGSFAVRPELPREINTGNFVKNKAVAFDGYAHKSLTEVIPSLLADIHSEAAAIRMHIGAKRADKKIFDFDTGRFTTAREALSRISVDENRAMRRGYADLTGRFDRGMDLTGVETALSSLAKNQAVLQRGMTSLDGLFENDIKSLTDAISKSTGEEKKKLEDQISDLRKGIENLNKQRKSFGNTAEFDYYLNASRQRATQHLGEYRDRAGSITDINASVTALRDRALVDPSRDGGAGYGVDIRDGLGRGPGGAGPRGSGGRRRRGAGPRPVGGPGPTGASPDADDGKWFYGSDRPLQNEANLASSGSLYRNEDGSVTVGSVLRAPFRGAAKAARWAERSTSEAMFGAKKEGEKTVSETVSEFFLGKEQADGTRSGGPVSQFVSMLRKEVFAPIGKLFSDIADKTASLFQGMTDRINRALFGADGRGGLIGTTFVKIGEAFGAVSGWSAQRLGGMFGIPPDEAKGLGIGGLVARGFGHTVSRTNDFLFGEEGENGERTGGVLGSVTKALKEQFEATKRYLNERVLSPLRQTMDKHVLTPLKEGFAKLASDFSKQVISPLKDTLLGKERRVARRGPDGKFTGGFDVVREGGVLGQLRDSFAQAFAPISEALRNAGSRVWSSFSDVFSKAREGLFGESGVFGKLSAGISASWSQLKTSVFGEGRGDKSLGQIIGDGIAAGFEKIGTWIGKVAEPVTGLIKRAADGITAQIEKATSWLTDPETGLISRVTNRITGAIERVSMKLFGPEGLAGALGKRIDLFFHGDGSPDNPGFIKKYFEPTKDFLKKEIWEPLVNTVRTDWENAKKWAKESLIDPLKGTLQPFIDEMRYFWDSTKEWFAGPFRRTVADAMTGVARQFDNLIEVGFGKSLSSIMKENVLDPIKQTLQSVKDFLGSSLKAILRVPVDVIKTLSDDLKERQIRRGQTKNISADEQARIIRERGINLRDLDVTSQVRTAMGGQGAGAGGAPGAPGATGPASPAAPGSTGRGWFGRGGASGTQQGGAPGGSAAGGPAEGGPGSGPQGGFWPRWGAGPGAAQGGTSGWRSWFGLQQGQGAPGVSPSAVPGGAASGAPGQANASASRAGLGSAPDASSQSRVSPSRVSAGEGGGEQAEGRVKVSGKDVSETAARMATVETGKNTRTIADFAEKTYVFMRKHLNGVGNNLHRIAKALGVDNALGAGNQAADPKRGFLGTIRDGIIRAVTSPFSFAASVITGTLRRATDIITKGAQAATRLITLPFRLLGTVINAAAKAVRVLGSVINDVARGIGNVIRGVGHVFLETVKVASRAAGTILKDLAETIPKITQGLASAATDIIRVAGAIAVEGTKLLGQVALAVTRVGGEVLKAAAAAGRELLRGGIRVVTATLGGIMDRVLGGSGGRRGDGPLTPVYVVGGHLAGTTGGASSWAEAKSSMGGGAVRTVRSIARAVGEAVVGKQNFDAVRQRLSAASIASKTEEYRQKLLEATQATRDHLGDIKSGFKSVGRALLLALPMIASGISGLVSFFTGGQFLKLLGMLVAGNASGGLDMIKDGVKNSKAARIGGVMKQRLGRTALGKGILRVGGAVGGAAGQAAGFIGRTGSTVLGAAKGLLGGAGVAGLAGVGVNAAADAYMDDGVAKDIVKTGGSALQYGALGATIGSVVPGVGTAVGAGVGAAAGVVIENWEGITKVFSAAVTKASEILSDVGGLIAGPFNAVGERLGKAFDCVSNCIGKKFSAVADWFGKKLDSVGNFFTEKWSAFMGALATAWDGMTSFITSTFGSISDAISGAFTTLSNKASETWGGVKNFLGFGDEPGVVAQTAATVKPYVSSIGAAMGNAVVNSPVGMAWTGIASLVADCCSTATAAFGSSNIGSQTLVGERGPELLKRNADGTVSIIPLNASGVRQVGSSLATDDAVGRSNVARAAARASAAESGDWRDDNDPLDLLSQIAFSMRSVESNTKHSADYLAALAYGLVRASGDDRIPEAGESLHVPSQVELLNPSGDEGMSKENQGVLASAWNSVSNTVGGWIGSSGENKNPSGGTGGSSGPAPGEAASRIRPGGAAGGGPSGGIGGGSSYGGVGGIGGGSPGGEGGAMPKLGGSWSPAQGSGQGGGKVDIKPSEAVVNAINYASQKVGVDPGIMYAMARQESRFDPNIKAGTSSATGLYQFIKGTWAGMVRKYGKQYGIGMEDVRDPAANAMMGALFMRDNINEIKGALKGRKPTAADVYSAHFLGSGGARTFLGALGTGAIGAQLMPKAAAANKSVFFHDKGRGRPKTVEEIYDWMQKKIGGYGDAYAAEYYKGAGGAPSGVQSAAAPEAGAASGGSTPVLTGDVTRQAGEMSSAITGMTGSDTLSGGTGGDTLGGGSPQIASSTSSTAGMSAGVQGISLGAAGAKAEQAVAESAAVSAGAAAAAAGGSASDVSNAMLEVLRKIEANTAEAARNGIKPQDIQSLLDGVKATAGAAVSSANQAVGNIFAGGGRPANTGVSDPVMKIVKGA